MYKEVLTPKEQKIKDMLLPVLETFAKKIFRPEDGIIKYYLVNSQKDYYMVVALPVKTVITHKLQNRESIKAWATTAIMFDASFMPKFKERVRLLDHGTEGLIGFDDWKWLFSQHIQKHVKVSLEQKKKKLKAVKKQIDKDMKKDPSLILKESHLITLKQEKECDRFSICKHYIEVGRPKRTKYCLDCSSTITSWKGKELQEQTREMVHG